MCDHSFIVSHWRLTEKTQEADELICSKCLAIIDWPELMLLRQKQQPAEQTKNEDT